MTKLVLKRPAAEAAMWVLVGVAAYYAANYALAGVVYLLAAVGWEVRTTTGLLALRVIIYLLIALLLAVASKLYYRRPVGLADFGLKRWVQWKDIGLSLTGAVLYVIGTVAVLNIAAALFGLDTGQQQDLGVSNRLFGSDLMLAFVVFVIATPVLEEMLFRGFLYGKLRQLLPKITWWLPAVVVSALFGLAHGQWNVGLDVFVLSMVACGLREVTGSIWGGIVLHMLKNMVAFMATFVLFTGFGG